MKNHDQAPEKASKQLESEGKNFLKPPAFALSASPAENPEGDGAAAQFKKSNSNGGAAEGNGDEATQFKKGDAGGDGAGSGGGDLPTDLRSQMESSLGGNFGNVKINANSAKASEMGALAYTQGEEIHFAPGQFQPGSHEGQTLIGHELAHVVQQREGRVQATGSEKGMAVNTDHGLEAEADQLGAKAAAQMKSASADVQQQSVGSYAGGIVQKAEDPCKVQYEAYAGEKVGKAGRISASAKDYEIAKTIGVRIRPKPDGSIGEIGRLRYNDGVQVLCLDKTGAFYFVAGVGAMGWINRNYVALDPPAYMADLHHVTEGDLTTILKTYYVDSGRWSIGTGNDYTTLAAAVISANGGRAGVSVDWKKAQHYKDEHGFRSAVDPWMIDNFAIYHASKVVKGSNIWLPPAEYVRMLQSSGEIGSRPDWLNTAIAVGKSLTGFTIGVQAGIYGDLWDMLTGLWDTATSVIDTIKSVLDGSLFSNIADVFEQINNMSKEKALEMAKSVLNMAKSGVDSFMESWEHGDEYTKWFFRGKIVGTIVTEVVLAIVTAGASLGEQVIGKLATYFPKLAKIGMKILKVADKLTPGGGKSKKPHVDMPDGPHVPHGKPDFDPNDNNARDWFTTLGVAKLITEGHDAIDTPVSVLLAQLNGTLAKKSTAVKGYEAIQKAPGHYEIVQFTRRANVRSDYTTKDTRRNVDDHEGPGLGHTRERHIGKSDNWLKQRLADDPNLENASTFFNEAGANRAQGLLVKKHKLDIDRWLQGRDSQLTFSFDVGSVVGSVLERGKARSEPSSKVFFLLRRTSSQPQGWYFHTSFVIK